MMFDNIFMINLKRRPDRRKRMNQCFDELGLKVQTVDAVDGKYDISLDLSLKLMCLVWTF